jgi:hypothetical protein
MLYTGNVQTIGGLCSPVPAEEPYIEDYLRWLSDEVSGLPSMFSSVNENFASSAIEGALAMAEDLVDLNVVDNDAGEGGADVLPAGPAVRRATQAVSKKCWHLFGYDYVLSIIHARQEEIFVCLLLSCRFGGSYSVIALLRLC